MRNLIAILIAILSLSQGLSAQEVVAVDVQQLADTVTVAAIFNRIPLRQRLEQPDSVSGARVRVVEHGTAAVAVAEFAAATDSLHTTDGYRIRIFADNGQSARAAAFAAQNRLNESYIVPSDVVYENPYYLVNCGNCATKEKALLLL